MPNPRSSVPAPGRRPHRLLARVAVWPTLVLLLSGAATATQGDGVVGGLLGLAVLVGACGVLAAADASVLRPRAFVLVWSATLVVLGVAFRSVALPALVQSGQLTGQAVAHEVLPNLSYGFPVVAVALVLPVALGALLGRCLVRAGLPSTFGPLGPG